MRKIYGVLLLFFVTLYTAPAFGIDNPDAPDYVEEFYMKTEGYEEIIAHASNTSDSVSAYAEYFDVLDKELNKAYGLLRENLDQDAQESLKQSQRKWLAYRDAEFDFIASNWNRENFGSSSVISMWDYRITIVKNRVLSLLYYLQNY